MSNKNPLTFIADLLNRPDISNSDRERIRVLASITTTSSAKTTPSEAIPHEESGSLTHSPQDMVSFLYQCFSKNDTLKWFVHSPDVQEFDYLQQMKAAKSLHQIHKQYNINPRTWMLVYNYILSNSFWVNYEGKKIIHNWQSSELSEWCSSNKGKHPASKESGLIFKDGSSFESVVKIFKHSIRFRTDDSSLIFYKRLKSIVKEELSQDFKIKYSDELRGCDVDTYIDVRRLFAAIKMILSWISDNKAKGDIVQFDYSEDKDTISLIIFHEGSYLSAALGNKLQGLSGDWADVRSLLFSVADWNIQADNGNGQSLNINCLDHSTLAKDTGAKAVILTPNSISPLDNTTIGGVKHIITMHKNV